MIFVKKIMVMLIVYNSFYRANAQPVYSPAGSPYLDAISITPLFTDAFSCAWNPAAICGLRGFAAGFYLEKKYMVQGLNFASFSVAYGKKSGGVGASVKYFGNPLYNEVHAALNYGKRLGNVNIGASFNYNAYSIAGFGKLSVFCLGFHTVWKLSEEFYTSVQIINPPLSHVQNLAFKQEAEYHLGFGYEPSPAVCLSMEFQKIENIPLQITASIQHRFNGKAYAKMGLFSGGPQPFIGVGWLQRDFHMQLSVSYHPALGCSPGMLFTYERTGGAALQ
jgi:hypothetical protein